jgi:hypothetical protein
MCSCWTITVSPSIWDCSWCIVHCALCIMHLRLPLASEDGEWRMENGEWRKKHWPGNAGMKLINLNALHNLVQDA